MKTLIIAALLLTTTVTQSHAYFINGNYASLISCEWNYSSVRRASGYTGTYKVLDEIWTVWFGSGHCKY